MIKARLLKYLKEKGLLYTLWIIVKNIYRVTHWFFFRYIPLQFLYISSLKGVITKEIQGSYMMLNLNDKGISRELAITGVHEKASTEQTKREIKEGMNVLEIGANIGYYALIEAKLIGEEGKVYAIEPDPRNLQNLKDNVSLNDMEKRFEFFNYAIGSKKGRKKFYLLKKGNLSSFIDRDELETEDYIWVNTISGDEFLKDKKVDYIRMDIEGYELEALKGLKETLSLNPPERLFIEVHSELLHKINSSCKEILLMMKGYGYDVSKAFFRGNPKISVSDMNSLLTHKKREEGYWETFFVRNIV